MSENKDEINKSPETNLLKGDNNTKPKEISSYIPRHLRNKNLKNNNSNKKVKNKGNIKISSQIKPFIPINSINEIKSKNNNNKIYSLKEEQDKNNMIVDYDQLISMENMDICKKTNLLSKEVLRHLERLKTVEFIPGKIYHLPKKEKSKIEESLLFEIEENLKKLTEDNYQNPADNIYEIIKKNKNYQKKFLEIIFDKIANEDINIKVCAKLCKECDSDLPQKLNKKEIKAYTFLTQNDSKLKVELIKQSEMIINNVNIGIFNKYNQIQNSLEREKNIKNLILGTINFINELINIKFISKDIIFKYIDQLFINLNDSYSDKFMKMINLESIIVLLDNFGVICAKGIKKKFKEKFNNYLKQLSKIKKNKDINKDIKTRINNLIQLYKNILGKDEIEEKKVNTIEKINPFTQNEIICEIKKDLILFKEYIEKGGNIREYDWSIIENIYCLHFNSISEIIHGFLKACLDFVDNKQNITIVKDYFSEIIFYYKKILKIKEKKDIIHKTLHLLRFVKEDSLKNAFILEIWSIILSNLLRAHLFNRDNLIELNDLDKDKLEIIFAIIATTIKSDPDAKIHYEKCKFVQMNKELYDEALKKINL